MQQIETITAILDFYADLQPKHTAIMFLRDGETVSGSLTYGELRARAVCIASNLSRVFAPCDRVLLLFPPGLEFVEAFFGTLFAGLIAVPLPPPRRDIEGLFRIANNCQASGIVAPAAVLSRQRARLDTLENIKAYTFEQLFESRDEKPMRPVHPSSVAMLQYTSGSTGHPKGVVLTHQNIISNQRKIAETAHHEVGLRLASWLPIYHDMGLFGGLLQPLFMGGTAILTSPFNFLQRPLCWLKMISAFKIATSGAPTFAYDVCVDRIPADFGDLDLSSWRVAVVSAERVRASTLERFAQRFAAHGFDPSSFHPCYGLAEATLMVTATDRRTGPIIRARESLGLESGEERLVSSGRAVGDTRVVILKPGLNERVPDGKEGEICISGPSVSQGYWGHAAIEREWVNDMDDLRPYFRTRDLGLVSDGELFVTGRLDDLIIVRGRNYHPADLEELLRDWHNLLHPARSAAFGVTADETRVVLVSEVAARSDWTNVDWQSVFYQIRHRIAESLQLPLDGLVVVAEGTVPVTTSGKVRRRHCRELFERALFTPLAEWRSAEMLRAFSPSALPPNFVHQST